MTQKPPLPKHNDEPVVFITPSGKRLVAKANPENITVLTDKLPDRLFPWDWLRSRSKKTQG